MSLADPDAEPGGQIASGLVARFQQARAVEAHEGWHFQHGANLPVVAGDSSPETGTYRTATARLRVASCDRKGAEPETRDVISSRRPGSSTETAASAGGIQRRSTFTSFGQLARLPQT